MRPKAIKASLARPPLPGGGTPVRRGSTRCLLYAALLITLLIFALRLTKSRANDQLVASDGIGYYSYLRSLAIDHDLDFSDEYRHFSLPRQNWQLTPTGRVANKYAVGSALLWLPFFAVAHVLAELGHALGLHIEPDGYGYLYEAGIAVGSIVYGVLGFVLSLMCAGRLVSRQSAELSASLLWLASPALYYMVFEPSMSHMVALFSVALVLSIWFLWFRLETNPPLYRAAILGTAAGLVMLVRLQDALFLLLPFGAGLLRSLSGMLASDRSRARRWLLITAVAAGVSALCFVPQLVIWQLLNGSWTANPYAADHDPAFYWLTPKLGAVLFSTYHGLFTWHPVFLVSLVGLALLARRDRRLAAALALLIGVEIYIVASWWAWWQGAASGGRMFLSGMWIWVLGLAIAIEWLSEHKAWIRPASAAGVLLVVWNGAALLQYRLNYVPSDAPLSWRQMTVDRVAMIGRLLHGALMYIGRHT